MAVMERSYALVEEQAFTIRMPSADKPDEEYPPAEPGISPRIRRIV